MNIGIVQQRLKTYQCQTSIQEEQALKEIAQEIALAGLSRGDFFKKAAFQGGTCLRILHGLNRFSEDLDFVLKKINSDFGWQVYLDDIRTEFDAYGIHLEIVDRSKTEDTVQKAWIKTSSIGKILQARFDDNAKKLNIKLEIDTNPPSGSFYEIRYLDFPFPFAVLAQDLPSLFASKSHALLCREYTKGRDWHDFLWYAFQKIPLNNNLLSEALNQIGPWQGRKIKVNREWYRREMEKKIMATDWSEAKRDIERFLNPQELEGLKLWSKGFFQDRLKNYFTVKYQVHVFCNDCGKTHPMPITINLDDGPAEKASLNDTYAGRSLPPQIANLIENSMVCPETKKSFTQSDNNQVFLVAIKNATSPSTV